VDSKVLAFYYTWYGTPWGPSDPEDWHGWGWKRLDPDWVHRGRREIAAVDYPLAGPYDSESEETIHRHLTEARQAGLDGFVVSWWGFEDAPSPDTMPGTNTIPARATETLLELAPDDFDVTVYHESADYGDDRSVEETVGDDLSRLLAEYADDPSWLTVDGSPVVFEYKRVLQELERDGDGVESWHRILDRLAEAGHDPFLVGDTFDPAYLDVFDGIHTYNPTTLITGGEDVAATYREAAADAHEEGALFAGTVLPGYDDRILSDRTRDGAGHLLVKREDGRQYGRSWEAVEEADADWALVTSFNEWYEGSTIEPAREYGLDYVDLTAQYAGSFREE
jgi:hypothetical protein